MLLRVGVSIATDLALNSRDGRNWPIAEMPAGADHGGFSTCTRHTVAKLAHIPRHLASVLIPMPPPITRHRRLHSALRGRWCKIANKPKALPAATPGAWRDAG
jgi:hypothetical protein